MKIAIAGSGYVGLVTAACMSEGVVYGRRGEEGLRPSSVPSRSLEVAAELPFGSAEKRVNYIMSM